MFPAMLKSRAVRRPYRSDSVPINGEARAWRILCKSVFPALRCAFKRTYENKLPSAPPRSTMSYLESIGLAKEAL
jgi:hypothetical protein